MHSAIAHTCGARPPGVVRRNTLLLAAAQAFVGVGNQMVPTLGAIIVARLLGSVHLAGMATSALGVSRFLVSYPIGRVADVYGRRVAVVFGLVLGLAGAVTTRPVRAARIVRAVPGRHPRLRRGRERRLSAAGRGR